MSHGTETGLGDKVSQVLNFRDYAVLRLFGYTVEVSDVFFAHRLHRWTQMCNPWGEKHFRKLYGYIPKNATHLWARLTFAYEEYLHVRVEVTRERIWKSQDAHRARNNTRCKNEIFHAVRTKWYALSAPLGSKAHTSILLHSTPVSTTIVIRDLPH